MQVNGSNGSLLWRFYKDKTPIFGMMQVGGQLRTRIVPNTKGETLNPLIKEFVKDGSLLVSDEWEAYSDITEYDHVTVDHSAGEYVRGGFDTNKLENYWSIFKRGYIGIYHKMSRKHMQRYSDEFTFRRNFVNLSGKERFSLSLKNLDGRLTFDRLIEKSQSNGTVHTT